jgi:hypothetical protein
VISINGKEYKLRNPTDAENAYWEFICLQELKKLYNPVNEFLKDISPELQPAALTGFIASRQNKEYPFYYKLLADNSLECVKLLVEMTTDCSPEEITEENKYETLNQIRIFWNDPELAKILELERNKNGTTDISNC